MNTPRFTKAVVTAILLLLGGNCSAANFSWITSGGNWSTASNWRDENGHPGVPGVNDSAVIGTETQGGISGGVTVDTQASVGNLFVYNTTITISSLSTSFDLDVLGTANIEVSTLTGGVFNFSGPLNFNPAPAASGIPAINTIMGQSLVQCTGMVGLSSSTQLCVASSQFYNSGTMGAGDGAVISTTTDPDAEGPGGLVENFGLLSTGGNVSVTRNVHFFNDGLITVNGTLSFNGDGTTVTSNSNTPLMTPHGEFDTFGPGSKLELDCQTNLLTGTVFGGSQGGAVLDGTNQFSTSGTVTVGGTAGGQVSLTLGPDSGGHTGTLIVHGNLDVLSGDSFSWAAGFIKILPTTLGTITMERGGSMQMPTSGTNSLLGVTLDTKPAVTGSAGGAIIWSGTTDLQLGSSALIQNYGSFQDSGAGSISSANIDGGSITNTGSFAYVSSTSAAATTISVPFSNFGLMTCTSGTLRFANGSDGELQGGSTNSTIKIQSPGVIDFNGGVHSIVGGVPGAFLYVTGNGTIIVDGTAALAFSSGGSMQISGTNIDPVLELDANGTIGGDGNLQLGGGPDVTIGGVLNWTGGTLGGSGTTSIGFGCTLAISGTSDKTITGGRQLLNSAGISTWQDAGRIVVGDGVLIDNQKGTPLNIFNDSKIVVTSTGGAPPLLQNEGIIDKKSGTATTLFGLNVLNLGSIEVDAGTIEYGGTYSDTQPVSGNLARTNEITPLDVASTGSLLLESGTTKFDNTTTIDGSLAGAGTVIAPAGLVNAGFWLTGKLKLIGNLTNEGDIQIGFLPEVLTIDGNFTQTSAGDLVIPIDGTNPAFSEIALLKVTGAAMLGGTFQAAFEDGFSPRVGETFGFLTAGSIAGQFDPIQVPNGAGTLKGSGHSLTLDVTHLNPSPVAAVAGHYNGLIQSPGTPTDATTGFIALQLNQSAAFTSSIKYGGKAYTVKGIFQTSGSFSALIPHTSLLISIAVDIANHTDTLTGTITDLSTNVAANIAADRAVFNSKTHPEPLQGHYTVLIGTSSDTSQPQGVGYGTASLDGNGMLKFVGKLGDGTAVSQSVPISKNNLWPFFATPYGSGGGSISGGITFENALPVSDMDGTTNWFKEPVAKPSKNALYPAGFTAQVSLLGSQYHAPKKGTAVLLLPAGSSNATITISAGGLSSDPAPITATLGTNNKVVVADPSQFKMSIATGTGLFTGSFLDSGKTYHFAGALFQKPNQDDFSHAKGQFNGIEATGSIDLEANH